MVNILMSNMSLDKKWCRIELCEYIKPDSRVVIFGFHFYREQLRSREHWDEFYDKKTGAFYEYITKPFSFFGVGSKSIKWINFFKDTPSSALRKIKGSDVLVLTDGIEDEMLEIIDRLKLREAIKNYKGIIIGFGAGAEIQTKGLGLTDGVNIEISADEADYDEEIDGAEAMIYAITDDGAVVADNKRVFTLGDVYMTRAEDGKQDKKARRGGSVKATP